MVTSSLLESEVPISKTKILLPNRGTDLLSRARLLEILFDRLDRKLIIVSAAAGYGKTSLLIDLAHHSDLVFCWLALDPLDRDPQRFIAYFIAALSERFPQFGNRSRSALNALTSLEEGMERLLVTLINEIYDDIHEHFVLVLDDFHLVDEVTPIYYFVNRFVQLAGENCHLVLSSRTLPELADIPLLVAREQVGGLDFSDLAFRPEEIQSLLAQNKQVHLSDEDARQLAEATEGWITGLQFTDLSQAHSGEVPFRPMHGVGVSVFDYLGQQVLEQQPQTLQTFILRSSMLEEFDIALCDAVLAPLYPEPQEWAKLFQTIVQKNLFIQPVGRDGQWLRYHHLFRDYLQEKFRRDCPEEVDPILQRLAEFHEAHGDWEKAYQLRKQFGNIQSLAEMIERAAIPMLQRAMLTLDSWMRNLPPSLISRRAGLLAVQGSIEVLKGRPADALVLFNGSIEMYREDKDMPGLAMAVVRRASAHRLLGNYAEAIEDADEVMRITEGNDDLQWIYAQALRVRGLSLYRQGQTLQAVNQLERALDIYIRINDANTVPLLLMETGMAYSALGNHRPAIGSYEKALTIWRQQGNLTLQTTLLNNYGFLHYQLGDYEKAAQALEEGLLCAQASDFKRMVALTSISLGDLYCEIEDFEIARQNYDRVSDLVQQLGERFLINYLAIARASLALHKHDNAEAQDILNGAVAAIKASHSNYESGYLKLMQGRLALQNDKPSQAIPALEEAKRSFSLDGREMESVWSTVWLAAALCRDGKEAAAKQEIKSILPKPTEVNYAAVVAARQANNWLESLRTDPEVKATFRPLFEKADKLDDSLPRLRRQLRRLARTIEVPAAKLVIRAFGQGQVWLNGKAITMSEWQTQSVRELFFYFLSENRPLTKEQIAGALWGESLEPVQMRLRFKNEIYRLRRAVGQDTILFDGEYYQFNPAIDHEYDVEAFDAYVAKARTATTDEEKIIYYQKAVDLVNGQYLEDISSSWDGPDRERLRQAFLTASLSLAELYNSRAETQKAIQTCLRALTTDATCEPACRFLMNIYHRQGDRTSVIHSYQSCEQAMQKVFGMPPSEETQELYRKLIT